MFLIERMIGVSLYSIVLLIVFWTIFTEKINYKKVLNIYLIILTVMAYLYVPYKTADLYRIFNIMELVSHYNFGEFAKYYLMDNSCPVAYVLYWIFGRLGIEKLLPAFICFIVYYILFKIIKTVADKYKISNPSIALVVFFLMSTGSYIMVISNIRTMLALSLICYCYSKETIEHKFNILHLVLYSIAVLTHNLAVVVIGLRIIVFIVKKKKNLSSYFVTALILLIIGVLTISYGDFLLFSVTEKALSYITGDTYSYLWDYILATLILFLEIYVLFLEKRTYKRHLDIKEYRKYINLTIIVAIIFCTEFSIYHRILTYFTPMLIMPFMLYTMDNIKIKQKSRYKCIFILSLVVLLLSCVRGSMSSLKFFVL